MYSFGRFLQFAGLVIVPMGLIYYVDNLERLQEDHLFGELLLLAVGSAVFLVGTRIVKRSAS